jgi:hypothetical protein
MLPTRSELGALWNRGDTNLESLLLIWDFFRDEEGDSRDRGKERSSSPRLICCKDGGMMAMYAMDGIDPEPLGNEDRRLASQAVSRALDLLSPTNLDSRWAGGTWEVQNIFTRRRGRAPVLPPPSRPSAALQYLAGSCNAYWQQREVFHDEIVWTFKFLPRFRLQVPWRRRVWGLLDEHAHIELIRSQLRDQARMMRQVLQVVEETMMSYRTRRPRMDFGLRGLSEQQCFDVLWRQVNRRDEAAPRLRTDLRLVVQVAGSERDNAGSEYRVNGRPTKVLTWKVPPSGSIGYMFARLQNELRFPFTLAQTFRAIQPAEVAGKTKWLGSIARALSGRHKKSADYAREASRFLAELAAGSCPFDWQFSMVFDGASQPELEERAARLSSQLRSVQEEELDIQAGEPIEERANRVWAELASLPGNGQFALRENRITSRAAGDLGMVFRLSPGDQNPFMMFGDRKGGVFAYSLFTRREPSWNKAVLGLPGSGKSMLLNAFLLGTAMFPSQAYVLDKGNSYGPIFELLAADMPDEVSVMRLGGGQFKFNPFPLVWALREREKQRAEGTYRMALADGGQLPCPVEDAKRFFEAWLPGLIGAGKPLDREEREFLDRALKGQNGKGGFFLEYEAVCQRYIREASQGRMGEPPRPLLNLHGHLVQQRQAPQLAAALQYWTRAPRDQYFDSGTDTVSNAKYIYFELTGLKDDPSLVAPFVGALMGTIWKRMQNPRLIHERKALFMDEWWTLVAQTDEMFAMADEIGREARRFNGFIVAGSQSPRDVNSGRQRALMQCMSEKFLFGGYREESFMRQDLQLKDHHLRMHQNLRADGNRREVFYVSEKGLNRVLSIEIPPALYWFATTDAEDKFWRAAYSARFGGLAQGVEHLVAACQGRTVAADQVRLQMVAQYAAAHGVRREGAAA